MCHRALKDHNVILKPKFTLKTRLSNTNIVCQTPTARIFKGRNKQVHLGYFTPRC